MTFDWTINVGNVVAIAVAVSAWVWGAARLYSRLEKLEGSITSHTAQIKQTDDRVIDLVEKVAGIMGALNPLAWVRPQAPRHYEPSDPGRLPG